VKNKDLKAALNSEGLEKVVTEVLKGKGANGEDIARVDQIEDDYVRGLAIVCSRDIQALREALG